MSNRSLGPLQLSTLTLVEINRALRLIQDRVDTAYGLRGVHTVHDRLKASAPTEDGDVVTNPVTSTVLPSSIAYKDQAGTITGLWTFNRGADVPFAVAAASLKVTNFDADLVDGQHRTLTIDADHNHQTTGAQGGQLDHGLALTGLTDDDHTNYVLLAGRATGQTVNGGTAASENLVLKSTAHATKGKVTITDLSSFTWEDANGVIIHQFGA